MTDKEIIKALECCTSGVPPCATCKYDADTVTCDECMGNLMQDALDLIKSQKAEIDELQLKVKLVRDVLDKLREGQNEIYQMAIKAKTEAYKEFAERFREVSFQNPYLDDDVVESYLKDTLTELTAIKERF